MRILLDTCTFLWLALEPERLSPLAVETINDEGNALFLSQISSWEMALKVTAKKLHLPQSLGLWVPSRRAFFGIEGLPVAESAIFRSGDLPLLHLDPFDRILAAQAIEGAFTILSPDTKLDVLGVRRVW